jgi:deoxycytidylate deaminase
MFDFDKTFLDQSINPPGSEIFIGLVGPVGVNLHSVQDSIASALKKLDYTCVEIKLSDWISEHCDVDSSNDYLKLKGLMEEGSNCRRLSESGEFLALYGVKRVWQFREAEMGLYEDSNIPRIKPSTCYFFNQLKHPDEVRILRWLYGASFYLVGVYAPLSLRTKNLSQRINKTSELTVQECDEKAVELIDLDYSESSADDYGQSIQKTFPLSDVFFNENSRRLKESVERFVELMFSNPFHTPTKDEQGISLARTAALRSADLARQIGAAITTTRGEVVSIGCNDAPRPEGGQYWAEDDDLPDKRDFQLGYDSNDRAKHDLLVDLLEKIAAEGALQGSAEDLATGAVKKDNKLATARLFDVIEYFRSVHAEMAALIDAARRGISVKGCTMYATTFPCHECAKHIVAAGIPRVVYIEPYPKSRALELFDDAIVLDERASGDVRTTFESFVGIAPRKFADLFELGAIKRKDPAGQKRNWTYKNARLRKAELSVTYVTKETLYTDVFEAKEKLVLERKETGEGV